MVDTEVHKMVVQTAKVHWQIGWLVMFNAGLQAFCNIGNFKLTQVTCKFNVSLQGLILREFSS